ncbi:MAG: glycerophosphodiester phosphodiesterase [Candidatus Heimdallarchaeum aukensis]|uniref:Glycerophosphodiester phosphodiesterase n=1 Tax=Candidatus Heimdallarchaeum aukensis TaxID=2876573 RepID=A0A9Y1FKP5_9ARCH|nr:MAG: glycerophosphodiester phosphodiesterase [Candidatus Heimdallarchaeum aukensis]
MTNKPLIIAHRGASAEAYENSFSAFKLAVEQKADMIELDTHLTKDGFFIVHHDPEIKYNNRSYLIKETTFEELKKIKLPNNERIPLLKDVLQQFIPSISINVEIKCKIKKEQFYDCLREIDIDYSKIMVSSFHPEVIEELKNRKLGFSLAFLFLFPNKKVKEFIKREYIDTVNPYYRFLNKSNMQYFKKLNKKVVTWTVDKKRTIKKCLKLKVDGIITNKPRDTRKIVEEELSS